MTYKRPIRSLHDAVTPMRDVWLARGPGNLTESSSLSRPPFPLLYNGDDADLKSHFLSTFCSEPLMGILHSTEFSQYAPVWGLLYSPEGLPFILTRTVHKGLGHSGYSVRHLPLRHCHERRRFFGLPPATGKPQDGSSILLARVVFFLLTQCHKQHISQYLNAAVDSEPQWLKCDTGHYSSIN